jgi:hypothetical protein
MAALSTPAATPNSAVSARIAASIASEREDRSPHPGDLERNHLRGSLTSAGGKHAEGAHHRDEKGDERGQDDEVVRQSWTGVLGLADERGRALDLVDVQPGRS